MFIDIILYLLYNLVCKYNIGNICLLPLSIDTIDTIYTQLYYLNKNLESSDNLKFKV